MAAFTLNLLTRGQQRELFKYEETRQAMWDSRLDNAHDKVIAEAGAFIFGATGHEFTDEKTIKAILRAMVDRDHFDPDKEFQSDHFEEW